MMKMNAQNFLIPIIISNVFALILIFICYKWPKAGKITRGVLFILAGAFNIYTALSNPHIMWKLSGHLQCYLFIGILFMACLAATRLRLLC